MLKFKDLEVELLIRVSFDTEEFKSFSNKFGVSAEEAEELIKFSEEMGVKVTGVCFHIGT